jgi:O-antigen/teichoic acid export membrane protein
MATVGSGALMSLVHLCSKVIPGTEYAALGTLVQLLTWMAIPALGLQMVFTQQASAVLTLAHRRQLVGAMRAVTLGAFSVWLLMALLVFLWRAECIAALRLTNPAALWVTLAIGLLMLWSPVFQGLMQGRQNFLWLGWAAVVSSVGRLSIAAFVVLLLGAGAAGIMTGVLVGAALGFGVALWQSWDLWREPSAPFDWRTWLARVIPLTVGFGASQFLFSADLLIVQAYLGKNGAAAPYVFGGTLARAIVFFTGPLAAVMFPKIVHSAVRSQPTNLMRLTLLGTAVLSALAAVGLTLTGPLLIRLGSTPANLAVIPLLPLFAWSMVPLAIANVLLSNFMAHSHFKLVPFLVLVAAGYWVALQYHHASFKAVIQTLGIFNLLFLAVCLGFTWSTNGKSSTDRPK